MNWKQIPVTEIEDMPLFSCWSRCGGKGAWATMMNAEAETFAEEGADVPTHMHFYTKSIKEAREMFRSMGDKVPNTIQTFSIEED